ncbi:hypothetical protein B0H14DRAFT_2395487 [Mycena olivaceomarginata]|nr:hypothetical protein B0H14DRAFT_2395487 [Mycena olivaceomarginata]
MSIHLENQIDGFRIFGVECNPTPAHQLEPLDEEEDQDEETIYIGNSHSLDSDGDSRSAGSIWYNQDDERNTHVIVPREMASQDAGAAAAILHAIQNTPISVILNFKIQLRRLVKCLTTDLNKCEDSDWAEIETSNLLKPIVACLRGRGTKCTFQRIADASDWAMKRSMEILEQGLNFEDPTDIITDIPPEYSISGLKLSKGTQRSFYRAIKERRLTPVRDKTKIMVGRTKCEAEELAGRTPTEAEIWTSLYHPDITRTTRDFLWKCMHQAYKAGEYRRNIPNFEHWALCQHCQVDDNLDHVLTQCEAPGREILWNLAKKLWELKGYQWPEISFGRILACSFAEVEDASGKRDRGADRLYRILVSETAHLIWKLRCLRVIERGSDPSRYFSEYEIHNRWLACINARLRTDILLTDRKKFGNRALNFKRVTNTWKRVLKDAENLTVTKISESRVLVGIAPLRPPGRNQ